MVREVADEAHCLSVGQTIESVGMRYLGRGWRDWGLCLLSAASAYIADATDRLGRGMVSDWLGKKELARPGELQM